MTSKNNYQFLPFRFARKPDHILLTNDIGEYYFLKHNVFDSFINKSLALNSEEFFDLKSKGFIYNNYLPDIIEMLSTKFRTKYEFLYDFTALHMFVVTLRCNQKCDYCHASSQDEEAGNVYDMDMVTARKSVEHMFNSPSPNIKIEFQGGEPLLNFDIVKTIVEYAEKLNEQYQKKLEFVICTNLVNLKYEHLDYFKDKNIVISTSLDGPRDIHNKCRKLRNGKGSYDYVVPKIRWAMEELGHGKVNALMTTTPYNLNRLEEVIDEYLLNGLDYIFLRDINPFGYAYSNKQFKYSMVDFIKSYKDALEYIIQINLKGTFFTEVFTTILLSRILTPFSTGFVDLQSPTGAGISGIIYDVNGDIFVSDEARMMYRTIGDKYFCIGNVHKDNWHDVFCNEKFKKIVQSSCIDALPGCSWCVYKPYCGGDPVRNYLVQGDMEGYRPTSEFCHKHFGVFEILFDYLKDEDNDIQDVFWSWITYRDLAQIRNYFNPEKVLDTV